MKTQTGSVFSEEQILISAPTKSSKVNEQEAQEASAVLANAKEISMHASVETVLLELGIIFTD